MAAMAPALTDAPAEAHHIRFKLAAPSSSLSPASAENNGNASNILIHSSGTVRCKATSEECPLDFCGSDQEQQQQSQADPVAQASALGKLQPLVASYLCSDVTPVPSTKESIKLQGVLIKQSVLKSHRILPNSLLNGGGDFPLRKRQAIELSGSHLKSLMSGSTNGGSQPMVPVNGLAKKLATMSGPGCVVTVNGDKPPATTDGQPQNADSDSETLSATLSGHIPVKGTLKQKHSPGVPQNTDGKNLDSPVHQSVVLPSFIHVNPDAAQQGCVEGEDPLMTISELEGCDGERPSISRQDTSPSCCPVVQHPPSCGSSSDSLDTHVKERTLLNSSRQAEIESRLRRLRKRLQVVQAKQVERHIQQQLGGFLDSTLSRLQASSRKSDMVTPTSAWRTGRHSSTNNRDGVRRFLKSGTMPLELERLYLSGSANLHSVERAFDSDVTESSSGGDSDLEEEELAKADVEQQHVKL